MNTTKSLPVNFLFSITADTGNPAPIVIPRGDGNLTIVTVMSGTFEGPSIKGRVLPIAGGDWISVRADGSMRLDVRIVLETDDKELIYMTYGGIGVVAEGGSLSLRTTPLFETSSAKYGYLNSIQAVATGSVGPGTVSYEVYSLL